MSRFISSFFPSFLCARKRIPCKNLSRYVADRECTGVGGRSLRSLTLEITCIGTGINFGTKDSDPYFPFVYR